MIRTFADKETERVAIGDRSRKLPPDIHCRAATLLMRIDAADVLGDLRIPPGNRLEPLSGNRSGQYSVRINAQWRVCFRWLDGNAYDVEITDYH